jgi:hypothetical protein
VTTQFTIAVEAVLDDVTPGATPGVISAQSGHCHSQITRRKNAELLA